MRLKITLLIICLIALGVRIGIIWHTYDSLGNYGMAIYHMEAARNIVEGRGFVVDMEYIDKVADVIGTPNILKDLEGIQPPENEKFSEVTLVMPAPAVLMAGTYIVFGEYRFVYMRFLQALIDTFGCLIIFLLGRKVFNKGVGLIAAGIYALFLPIAYLCTAITNDSLMPFILLCSSYLFIKGMMDNSIKYLSISAVTVGIGCYFQPTVLFLVVMYGVAYFIYTMRRNGFWAKLWKSIRVTLLMALIVFAMVFPWIVRNHNITDGWSVSPRGATWSVIWTGVGEYPDNPLGIILSSGYAQLVADNELGYMVEYGSPEFEEVFRPKLIELVTKYPDWCVRTILRRIPSTFFYYNTIGIEDYSRYFPPYSDIVEMLLSEGWYGMVRDNTYAVFCFLLVVFFQCIMPIAALLGFLVWYKKWRIFMAICAIPLYLSMVHMITFVSGSGKTLLPTSVCYIIMTSALFYFIYDKVKKRTCNPC